MKLPRITVVTPSFNQAAFLETTLLSVLGQCYPNLEYLVMDGGSSDGSTEIIRRYEAQLAHWVSAPDGGQAAALNAAFARATGEIFCWVNSDDFLLPGTLHRLARHFAERTAEPLLYYGSCLFFEDRGKHAKVVRARTHDAAALRLSAYIVQPSAFWTRPLWEKTGPLDASLSFAFDWDWFIRASALGRFETSEEILSAYRLHAAHKSGSGGEKRRQEIVAVVRRHGDPHTVATYEFVLRHWPAVQRWTALRRRTEKWPLPGAGAIPRAAVPALWRLPRGVAFPDVRVAAAMFSDA
jgi:glycosyltransferase involved in cell wall biosynthesis